MRLSSILLAVVILVFVISLLCVWFYPSEEDFIVNNKMWNGTRDFSGEFSVDYITSLDDLPDSGGQTVLVAIPYIDYNDEELSIVKRFVYNGGTLLLIDDYGYGNSVLAYLGVSARFTRSKLIDPLFYYNNQNLVRITDFATGVKASGIDAVMLNHATTLTGVSDLEAIAWSSEASLLDINENGEWDEGEPKGPFAVAAELRLNEGTLAIVADSSILINTMVDRDNNHSFIRYLTRGAGEQQKILVDSSHIPWSSLELSKTKLNRSRKALSNPYALLGITALIFFTVPGFALKKGENIGKN